MEKERQGATETQIQAKAQESEQAITGQEEAQQNATEPEGEQATVGEQQRDRAELLKELVSELQRSTDTSTFFLQLVATQAGIHITDMKVLSLLARLGPLRASRIANLSGLTTGAITFVLDRLEKLGYAHRVRSTKDRRVVLMEINPQALTGRFGNHFLRMAEITVEATTQLTDDQLALIVHFMQKLNMLSEDVLQEMKSDDK